MKKINILILSDVHYGDLAHLDTFGKSGVSCDEDLSEIARGIVDRLGRQVDFVFVLGDLTSRGSPGEFQDFYRFLSILRDQLKLNKNQVFITYGNHDVDWSISKLKPENPAHHKAYCVAAANIGGLFAPPGEYTFEGPVVGCGIAHLDGIDLISLNSGIECYNDQEIKHGRLGQSQFDWLKDNLPVHVRKGSTKIVILHHHLFSLPYAKPMSDLSILEEGSNVLEILGGCGIDIVMHGHRHHPIVHTASHSNWKKPITFFCAGSFGVSARERAGGRLPNTFHVACFDSESGAKHIEGSIETFELDSSFEWVPLIGSASEYPINQVHWFGAPDAMQKAEGEIESIISLSRNALESEEYFVLPDYNDLSLSLRCLYLDNLNKDFQSESTKHGLEITGVYPKKCIVMKAGK
jgi:predicted phosphodiesterase